MPQLHSSVTEQKNSSYAQLTYIHPTDIFPYPSHITQGHAKQSIDRQTITTVYKKIIESRFR